MSISLLGCGAEKSKSKNTTTKTDESKKETNTTEKIDNSNKSKQSDDVVETLFAALRAKEADIKSNKTLTREQKTYLNDFRNYANEIHKQNPELYVPKVVAKKLEEITAIKPYADMSKSHWYILGLGLKKGDTIVAVVEVTYTHKEKNLGAKDAYYITLKQKSNDDYEILDLKRKYDQEGNIGRMYDTDKSMKYGN